jgi:hypothetical protein
MHVVARLVTRVDAVADARRLSVSARHEAELADGRRVLLLEHRGWSSPGMTPVEDIEDTARLVVSPDEPFDPPAEADDDTAAGHWAALADVLRRHGVRVHARELRHVPHDVVLSERLRAQLGH